MVRAAGAIKDTTNNKQPPSLEHNSATPRRITHSFLLKMYRAKRLETRLKMWKGVAGWWNTSNFLGETDKGGTAERHWRVSVTRPLCRSAPILHLTLSERAKQIPPSVVSWSPTAACPSTSIRFLLPWILPNHCSGRKSSITARTERENGRRSPSAILLLCNKNSANAPNSRWHFFLSTHTAVVVASRC